MLTVMPFSPAWLFAMEIGSRLNPDAGIISVFAMVLLIRACSI